MVTVLVTGAGGVGGTATIKSLSNHTSHRIVAVDMDQTATGFFFADDAATVPAATDGNWLQEMTNVISEFDVDVVVPLVDEELPRVPSLADRVPGEVGFILPTADTVETTIDKYALTQSLFQYDLPTPQTYLATEESEITSDNYPLIVKPRHGRGSEGVSILDSVADLEQYIEEEAYSREEILLQEQISGTEYTTSVVVTKSNQLLSVVPKEIIEKRGNTVRGVTRENASIAESCEDIYKKLDPHGPLNVQQIIDEDTGVPYVIEINPRFSSTACLTVEAGVNELDLLIRDATGQTVESPEAFTEDLHLLRYTDGLYVDEDSLSTYKQE